MAVTGEVESDDISASYLKHIEQRQNICMGFNSLVKVTRIKDSSGILHCQQELIK